MTVKSDSSASIDFLNQWDSEGFWILTCISTDKKGMETRSFSKDERSAARDWIDRWNGDRNIYFLVNPAREELKKKADRQQIASLSWLHVDVDPAETADLEGERLRIIGLFTDRLPKSVPPPTCIIFSGGGFQAFWKLKDPLELDGSIASAENAKRWNQQLELLFGGDACHNIDRIMRLPGTINIPDAKKVKKGRSPTLAKLVEFRPERVYPLKQFTAAQEIQADDKGFSEVQTLDVGGDIDRISDLSELDPWDVPDRVKVIIAQGHHPDQPKKGDNSRSSWLFDAVCQLVRSGVPDKVIYSILTDPGWGIAESVLELGARAHKYAIKQIATAKEQVEDPWLRKLNSQFAVIENIGGKCRVVEEIEDEALGRTRLTKISFEDFRNRLMHHTIEVGGGKNGPQMKPVGNWWLQNPKRRQFGRIVFVPGKEVAGAYNLWTGFACPAIPGDCSMFLDHVAENICNGDESSFDYLIKWLARGVQHPASAGEVAIVMRGGRGTGKTKFAKIYGSLFGRHFMTVANSSHLVGNFNSHLRDCVVLFADEAFYANDKKHESILKNLVTDNTLTVEAKGVDIEQCPNYIHLLMASNEDHVVPAGADERRWMMLEVGDKRQKDTKFFSQLDRQMDRGGREALLHHLLSVDLTDFEVRSAPGTQALQNQKLLSLSSEERFWLERLEEGRLFKGQSTWSTDYVIRDKVTDEFVRYLDKWKIYGMRRPSSVSLWSLIKSVVDNVEFGQKIMTDEYVSEEGYAMKSRERKPVAKFPDLEYCRNQWIGKYGFHPFENVSVSDEGQSSARGLDTF